MKASYVYLFSGLLSAAMLVGCGGGSGGGSTAATAADITADNADDLSVAAAEATKTAIEAENNSGDTSSVPTGFFGKSSTDSAPLQEKLATGIRSATEDWSDYICDVSGSATINSNDNYDSGSFSFSNCSDGYDTYNGSITFSGLMSSTYSFTYNNFVYTDNSTGLSQTVNGTMTCTDDGLSCDYSGLTVGGESLSNSDFSGDDGRNYSFEGDVTVTGDDTNGWNVDATVVDPDHGAITISAQNVTFGSCPSGVPNGGTITVTGNGQTVTVTFSGCTSFSVTYGDSTTTYNWSDYGL